MVLDRFPVGTEGGTIVEECCAAVVFVGGDADDFGGAGVPGLGVFGESEVECVVGGFDKSDGLGAHGVAEVLLIFGVDFWVGLDLDDFASEVQIELAEAVGCKAGDAGSAVFGGVAELVAELFKRREFFLDELLEIVGFSGGGELVGLEVCFVAGFEFGEGFGAGLGCCAFGDGWGGGAGGECEGEG